MRVPGLLKTVKENQRVILSAITIFLALTMIISFKLISKHNLQVYHNKEITNLKMELESYYFDTIQSAVTSLSHDKEVIGLIKKKSSPDNKNILLVLNTAKHLCKASIVYVINREGNVIACSPYGNNETLTGLNFSFRPYFQKAMKGKKSIYPALGVITNERGVYFSCPIYTDKHKKIVGVMAIKMELQRVDDILSKYPHPVFLLSQDGIIFATNISKWVFRSAFPLSETDIKVIKESRQFHNKQLKPMPDFLNKQLVSIDGIRYHLLRESISFTGWEIIYLLNTEHSSELTLEQISNAIITLLTILILMGLIFFLLKSNEERKIAELKAQKNEENFKNLFNLAPDAIVITTPEGELVSYNEKFKNTFSYKDEELEHFDIHKLYKNPDKDRKSIVKTIREQEILKDYFVQFINPDGETIPSTISSRKITFDDRECIETVIRDMREIIKKDNQLQQIQKMEMVGTLAGGIAHDFNNVLGGIIGTLSLIDFYINENDFIETDKLKGYLTTLNEASSRASEMVNQLLLVSRKQELFFISADLNQCVENVKQLCLNSFDKSISINFTPYPEPAFAQIDTNLIEQSILNMAINSSHAMTIMRKNDSKWGGNLKLMIEKIKENSTELKINPDTVPSDYWKISIEDTGVGIPKENIGKIFDPFFSTKDNSRSIGLGLSMTYNVIKQHNGFIETKSDPGTGTTMKIYIPAVEDKEDIVSPVKKGESKIIMGTGLILVVDDEELMRKTGKKILEKCGYTVITAEDGIKALEVYRERHEEIDLVLLDMLMPNMSGKETFLEFRKINNSVPVILASGYLKDERVNELLDLGIEAFIQKPYTLLELSELVSDIMNPENN